MALNSFGNHTIVYWLGLESMETPAKRAALAGAGPKLATENTHRRDRHLENMQSKKNILLVGKDEALWREWREFAEQSPNCDQAWTPQFAESGRAALALCGRRQFDAVAAEICLPDMNGAELLDQVMESNPKATRILMSDLADMKSTAECIGKVHHHLLKPCDVQTLLNALNDALELESWLPSQAVQKLLSRMRLLPSPPIVYFTILAELRSNNVSIEKIADVIATDPMVTAKLLQLANSAVFGLRLQVWRPVEAISYLGLEASATVVLLAHTFSSFAGMEMIGISIESLWLHSVLTGELARRVAQSEGADLETVEQSFTAGLLHDIGKLLLCANEPDLFGQVLRLARRNKCPTWQAEDQLLPGANHADLGGCMLGIWNLPRPVVEAVALHHRPARLVGGDFKPLTAVHVADVLAHQVAPDPSAPALSTIDLEYLKRLGLDEHLEGWKRL